MFVDKKEELSILIYIGTNKISASFVIFSNNKPKIVTSVKLPFSSSLKVDEISLTQNFPLLLEEVILGLIKKESDLSILKNKKKIESVFVIVSSPWYISKIKNIHLSQESEFIISESFIQNVLNIEEKKFEKEIEQGNYEEKFGKNLSIIENTFTGAKINEYEVDDIFNKKTNNFDISIYSSIVSSDILKKIFHIIHKHTHISENKIRLNTFPLVFFHVIKKIDPNLKNFIIMDIMGEVTDLTLVHDKGINQNISFPSARNFIIRQIAKEFNVSFEIGESILHLYNSNKSDGEISDKINKLLIEIEKEWSIYLEDALLNFSKSVNLPPVVYLFSEEDVYPIYEFFLNTARSSQIPNLRRNMNIVHIKKEIYSDFCDFDANKLYDEYLLSSVIFYDKMKK